jgi:hypothetical protein
MNRGHPPDRPREELAEHGYGLRCVETLRSWMGWRAGERCRTVAAVFTWQRPSGEE